MHGWFRLNAGSIAENWRLSTRSAVNFIRSFYGRLPLSQLVAVCHTDKLTCGPMPNVMAALPNIGGALCSTPQALADAHCWSTVQ